MKLSLGRRSPPPAKAESRAKPKPSAAEVGWQAGSGYVFAQDRVPALGDGPMVASVTELAGLIEAGHILKGRRGLAVCGAAEGTGVTFVAVNLAVALAASGHVIRLVETNLHRPNLEAIIRPPRPCLGLTDYLLDERLTPADVVQPEVLPGLSVTYAGSVRPGASDLLASDRFSAFIQACLRESDLTILDTAPANRAADARVSAKAAGYALVVARRGRSFVDDVATLSAQLNQDGVVLIGSVMNSR